MDISKDIYRTCQEPITISVYNGITNMYDNRQVPCGKCYHCKITRINEWVTRMVAESNYNKYVYFGSLTYNGLYPTIYNNDCLSIRSNFNKNKTYNDTPLILRKDHLQKFFKRLRKNTKVKFQYAACGEYGETYARPHFHYIIWSNTPISYKDIYKAWSAQDVKQPNKRRIIGKVEHRDIKNNPDPQYDDPDGTFAYKYVCKYIQKFDFNFDKLPNIKQHLINYYENFNYLTTTSNEMHYLSNRLDEYLKNKGIKDFNEYKKVFSPFFVCSKKPAIGFKYLQDNIGEFQKANFKLFGLPEDYVFPLYFIRKTKEKICPYKAQSTTNDGYTSFSRIPKMAALIEHIQNALLIGENTNQVVQLFWCSGDYFTLEEYGNIGDIQDIECRIDERDYYPKRTKSYRFQREYLGFVNVDTHVRYSFRYGKADCYFAMYNTADDSYIGNADIEDVKNLLIYYYDELKRKILLPILEKSKVSATAKTAEILQEYGSIENYEKARKKCIEQFNNNVKKRQQQYKLTKTFE